MSRAVNFFMEGERMRPFKFLKYCWVCHVNYDDECLCDIKIGEL